MRVIDADKFMHIILKCKKLNTECSLPKELLNDKDVNNYETGQIETFDLIIELLEKHSTSYDMDRVLEQLGQQAEQYRKRGFEADRKRVRNLADKYYAKQCSYLHATEIVKSGGIT